MLHNLISRLRRPGATLEGFANAAPSYLRVLESGLRQEAADTMEHLVAVLAQSRVSVESELQILQESQPHLPRTCAHTLTAVESEITRLQELLRVIEIAQASFSGTAMVVTEPATVAERVCLLRQVIEHSGIARLWRGSLNKLQPQPSHSFCSEPTTVQPA